MNGGSSYVEVAISRDTLNAAGRFAIWGIVAVFIVAVFMGGLLPLLGWLGKRAEHRINERAEAAARREGRQ